MSGIDDILLSSNEIIYDDNIGIGLEDDVFPFSPEETNQVKTETETEAQFESGEQESFIEQQLILPPLAPEILSSGIYALDRSIGGGIPAGSVIYFSTTTMSMSEVFLFQFTQSRKTYYFW